MESQNETLREIIKGLNMKNNAIKERELEYKRDEEYNETLKQYKIRKLR